MDINNDTNISNLISNSISKLNLNSSKIQPKKHQKPLDETKDVQKTDFVEEDKNLIDKKIANKIDVQDIQKYAQTMGETLSVEDINYGLMYGRSVIADYCV